MQRQVKTPHLGKCLRENLVWTHNLIIRSISLPLATAYTQYTVSWSSFRVSSIRQTLRHKLKSLNSRFIIDAMLIQMQKYISYYDGKWVNKRDQFCDNTEVWQGIQTFYRWPCTLKCWNNIGIIATFTGCVSKRYSQWMQYIATIYSHNI